jgi:hypothetical protein
MHRIVRAAVFMGLVTLPILAACDLLDEGDPEKAKVELLSNGSQEVIVVTSTDFVRVTDPDGGSTGEVILNDADTQTVVSPWDETFNIASDLRFYVNAILPEVVDRDVVMRVSVDGSILAQKQAAQPGDSMTFIYIYRK